MLGEFFDEKGVSAPQKLSDFFKKMVSKNNDFRLKKMKNYLKSKNDIKRRLGAFNQELWANVRIGGRTWYISQGMDRQFVDYLGTWASPEASARYYRENPVTVISKVRGFYANLRHPSELY